MEEAVDGEYQDFKSKNGAYVREHFFGKYPETAAMVADWTDDEIWALRRGGHDPLKVYAAYKAAAEHKGQPTRHPRQDRQGLRHGRGRRRPEHHPPAEEDGRGPRCSEFRDRFQLPIDRRAARRGARSSRFAEGSPEMSYLRERREALGGCLPAAPARSPRRWTMPPLVGLRGAAEGDRRPRDLDHDGLRAHPEHAAARQEDRQARRADRARREPHLRHGGHVPPVRHLQPGRPALPAAGCRPADVLQGGQDRARSCRRASTRPAPWRPGSRRRRPTRRRTRR